MPFRALHSTLLIHHNILFIGSLAPPQDFLAPLRPTQTLLRPLLNLLWPFSFPLRPSVQNKYKFNNIKKHEMRIQVLIKAAEFSFVHEAGAGTFRLEPPGHLIRNGNRNRQKFSQVRNPVLKISKKKQEWMQIL